MTMMTQYDDGDAYYDLIESDGYQLIVLGEIGEQWTDETLCVLKDAGVEIHLFSWAHIKDLRLQLELVHYPVTQLWYSGSLQTEFVGYHNEEIKNIIEIIK